MVASGSARRGRGGDAGARVAFLFYRSNYKRAHRARTTSAALCYTDGTHSRLHTPLSSPTLPRSHHTITTTPKKRLSPEAQRKRTIPLSRPYRSLITVSLTLLLASTDLTPLILGGLGHLIDVRCDQLIKTRRVNRSRRVVRKSSLHCRGATTRIVTII